MCVNAHHTKADALSSFVGRPDGDYNISETHRVEEYSSRRESVWTISGVTQATLFENVLCTYGTVSTLRTQVAHDGEGRRGVGRRQRGQLRRQRGVVAPRAAQPRQRRARLLHATTTIPLNLVSLTENYTITYYSTFNSIL